jgi:hypothetical protein
MTQRSITLALLPLDERPVNTRYPETIARMAGATLLLPPVSIRGEQRKPADRKALVQWLKEVAPSCTAVLVSCDYLGYGNLINARISDDTATQVISRLNVLTELDVPIHAFSLITRVSNADDNVEEPIYWKNWGTKFYQYSAFAHREMTGNELDDSERRIYQNLAQSLPAAEKAEWITRRLRNHTVNLALIDLAAHAKVESLLLTSDDTAAYGFPSRERAWLKSWRLLIPDANDRVSMHPGADEVGSALVAKLISQSHGRQPTIWVDYAIDEDSARIAPYEDRPVSTTISGQIRANGAELAPSAAFADLILGVLTPSPSGKDYKQGFLSSDRQSRTRPYRQLFDRLGKLQKSGKRVMLADVAYPNGADPLAMEILRKPDAPLILGSLAAYGAWNTAGNTLGVVIAQGICSGYNDGIPDRQLAHQTFLTHRFLEDWGYQTLVRREARQFAEENWGRREPNPSDSEEQIKTCRFIERRLTEILAELKQVGVGTGLKLLEGSTRLPWKRTFEVDFVLTTE